MKALIAIQSELEAPKDLYNSFGGYHYRSCESILAALKPLLKKHNCTLTIADDVHSCGERVYIRAVATISDGKDSLSVSAYAREPFTKKGMDEAQITGSASSYARKYALNGLFAIDDTKDADATNKHGKDEAPPKPTKKPPKKKPAIKSDLYLVLKEALDKCASKDEMETWAEINGDDLKSLDDAERNELKEHYKGMQKHL